MGERILEGSLKAISVPDVLTFVNILKKTGTLTLRSGTTVRRLYWERGEMVFATSSKPEESLGNFLVRHGKITGEQNLQSGLQVEPGRRQGKILVQMGILTPKQLWWAVKNQVLEIIYGLFTLNEGLFFFEETPEANEEKIKLSTSTTNIIMEGIRRLDEWPRIKELIPTDAIVPVLAPKEVRDKGVRFMEGELEILALVDGKRCVREIIHEASLDEFETLRILMALVLARYIQMPDPAHENAEDDFEDAQALEALVEDYNGLFEQISSTVAKTLDNDGRASLFTGAMEAAKTGLIEGTAFDKNGRLDAKALTANVADLPSERRRDALHGALDSLLSFLLFESSKHLAPEERSALYKLAEERTSASAG